MIAPPAPTYLGAPNIFRSFATLNMPGTSVITNNTGRMKITIGNSILIPALPTAASARRRRRVRRALLAGAHLHHHGGEFIGQFR